MNDELKDLFDKLPEGIVLFNDNTKKIALANNEFKKLFNIDET